MADVKVLRTGKWEVARRILAEGGGHAAHRVHKAIDQAAGQEAQFMRKMVVQGLREQAPGGQAFRPLAETTLAKRALRRFRGTKTLLVRGDLSRSITVRREHEGVYFIGVLKTARGRDGAPLANVAELNEFGSKPIVIRITARMRRFLALLARETGHESTGGGGGGTGIIVVRIPARPFMRPVAEKYYGDKDVVARRFLDRVSTQLLGDFGRPG